MQAKSKIKQAFDSASASYDAVAGLQRQIGQGFLARLGEINGDSTILDLGCGTGYLIEEFYKQNKVSNQPNFIALDIANAMLLKAKQRLNHSTSITYVCGDVEKLPLQAQSVDWVISNLALQWCQHLPDALAEIRRVLKSNGQFAFTTFGQGTLQELKMAWAKADNFQHVNTFYSAEMIASIVQQAGFTLNNIQSESYISEYKLVKDLMKELKQLGANTVLNRQNQQLTSKKAIQKMISAYPNSVNRDCITATYEVITVLTELDA